MRNFNRLTGLGLLICLSTLGAGEPIRTAPSPEDAVHVTIIYDNYQADTRLEADWGFACLVEYKGNKLLFDAGRKAELYKENAKILEINPAEIPSLFISHEHGDHTAGIPWITEVNPSVNCYLPSAYAAQLKASNGLPPNSKAIAEPTHLYGPYYSTGDNFEAFHEQGLVIKAEAGGVLITGCGHPGVVEMVEVAEKELGIEIRTVIGGLHLLQASSARLEEIAETLKKMGVQQICPTHCSGDNAIAFFKEAFGEGFIAGGTGTHITIE
jgi:7,8-dihydropterin-6-yl-methyl-4-(beta-D-ribofuranosyl)aminobenzene 5'-phosphate synthase